MATVTLNQLVYNLKNAIRGGLGTNDSELSDKQFGFIVGYFRATLVRRALEKNARLREFEQELLVPMTLDGSRVSTEGNLFPVLRSVSRLPETLRTKCEGLVSVETVDRQTSFDVTQSHLARHAAHGRYTSRRGRAYISDGWLYVQGHPGVESLFDEVPSDEIPPAQVIVRAIFESPEQVFKFQNPNVLYTGDEAYPFPQDLIAEMVTLAVKTELRALVSTETDKTLDGAGK